MDTLHDKMRIIQEFVPGKQITVAHVIANPDETVFEKAHIKCPENGGAIGIINITPPETSIVIADICVKGGTVNVEFIDRINGTLIITGKVSEVESALKDSVIYAKEKLDFSVCGITKT